MCVDVHSLLKAFSLLASGPDGQSVTPIRIITAVMHVPYHWHSFINSLTLTELNSFHTSDRERESVRRYSVYDVMFFIMMMELPA